MSDLGEHRNNERNVKVLKCQKNRGNEVHGGFLKWGVPPNHPFLDGTFHEIDHAAMGIHHLWKCPYDTTL